MDSYIFSFEEEMLRPFFPLEKVLSGLFGLCSRLFGLGFEEVKDVDCWHPDVRFFHVYEPNHDKPVAGFYFDPYQRYFRAFLLLVITHPRDETLVIQCNLILPNSLERKWIT